MSLHSQDREHTHQYQLQCLQEERQSGTLFALGLCLSISYITFIFKTKTWPPFSLQTQGGQKWGGRSSEGCYKVYFVPGIHISHDGPGKLHYLPLLEWESKISGISTALSYMQCNCLYKWVPWESTGAPGTLSKHSPNTKCAKEMWGIKHLLSFLYYLCTTGQKPPKYLFIVNFLKLLFH